MSRARRSAVALVAVGLCLVSAWTLTKTTDVQISTAPVTSGPITRRIVATGTLEAVSAVDVGTQVSGVVRSLEVDYNSLVRSGQVLARLDPSSFEAQCREAQAELAESEADAMGFRTAVEDAQAKLTRAEKLAGTEPIPAADLDAARVAMAEARADLRAVESTVAQSKAAVDQARVNLDRTIKIARSLEVRRRAIHADRRARGTVRR